MRPLLSMIALMQMKELRVSEFCWCTLIDSSYATRYSRLISVLSQPL